MTARVANKRHLGAGFDENRNGSAVGVCQFLRYDNRDLSRRREWLAILPLSGRLLNGLSSFDEFSHGSRGAGKRESATRDFPCHGSTGASAGDFSRNGLPGRSDSTKATRS